MDNVVGILWIIFAFVFNIILTFAPLIIIIVVIVNRKKRINLNNIGNVNVSNVSSMPNTSVIILKCAVCGSVLTVNHKFCSKCGAAFDGNNVVVEENPNAPLNNANQNTNVSVQPQKKIVTSSSFDSMFNMSESLMVEEFINRELVKADLDKNSKLIPSDALKRKKIFTIIFAVLLFIYISLIFFHFPIWTYIIGAILLFIFYKCTTNYTLMKYLKKQLKVRPSEKVSNIVMTAKSTLVTDDSKRVFIIGSIIAFILPMIIFFKPIIMYEKTDNGYGVRYYIYGLSNFTSATIPETHKGRDVVSLRGNTFSNMYFLKKVNLPDSVTEIRGQAFKNAYKLTSIKLPSKLKYLGGGAFYNCKSLKSIDIPDSVTYIGGEAFYNCKSLESVKLSSNISEIRGSTFENCTSLKSVVIPDNVTRIGGHAFYGNSSLSSVVISENSKLDEIGSSAFRLCRSLDKITIPKDTYVNMRAFKESPTDVKRIGDVELGSLINSSNYTYDTYVYIKSGETKQINQHRTGATVQDAYVKLERVEKGYDSNDFLITYRDNNGVETFYLDKDYSYKVINDNIAVEISADYVLKYDSAVSLNIYYN